MKTVKYVCPHCKKAVEYNKWEKLITYTYASIGPVLMAFGIFFIIFYYIVGPDVILEEIIQGRYNIENKKVDDELRLITMNITKECSTDKTECFIKEMYKNISNIRYVPTSIYYNTYDPLYVYKYGGDCKNTANMFVAMLGSVGTKGKIKCSVGELHCISEFNDNHGKGKFVVDLTIPQIVYMNKSVDAWDYMDYKPLDWD